MGVLVVVLVLINVVVVGPSVVDVVPDVVVDDNDVVLVVPDVVVDVTGKDVVVVELVCNNLLLLPPGVVVAALVKIIRWPNTW